MASNHQIQITQIELWGNVSFKKNRKCKKNEKMGGCEKLGKSQKSQDAGNVLKKNRKHAQKMQMRNTSPLDLS